MMLWPASNPVHYGPVWVFEETPVSAIILRLLLYAVLGVIVYLGVRKLWANMRGALGDAPPPPRAEDKAERPSGTIELERDKDGVYRPKDRK